jgi:hypothetical protein
MNKFVELATVVVVAVAVIALVLALTYFASKGCVDSTVEQKRALDSAAESTGSLKEVGQFMHDSVSDYRACVGQLGETTDQLKETVGELKECIDMAQVLQLLLKHCASDRCLKNLADRVAETKRKEAANAIPGRLETDETGESGLQMP